MQRLHERDLVGHVTSKADGSSWAWLRLAGEIDHKTMIDFPMTKRQCMREVGELLWWPER
jgi:hypothetical protein